MNRENAKKLITGVIENEFRHISQYKECDDFNTDVEISSAREKIDKLLERINELLPGNFELINDLESEITDYCTAACRYYFKEGVIAGTSNLNFLRDTTGGKILY